MSAAPVKILVVDDEPPIRKLLRTGLGAQGYEVLDAPNGKAALELLAKQAATSSSSISACRTSMGWSCCGRSASAEAACRSSCCPAAATRPARSRRSISAPTTT